MTQIRLQIIVYVLTGGFMETGEWLRDHLREFADRLEQSVVERERERAAIICHAMRDVEYPALEIAERIMGRSE